MKQIFTLVCAAGLLLGINKSAEAQTKVHATNLISSSSASSTSFAVENVSNATDGDLSTVARLRASPPFLLIGARTSSIVVGFDSDQPAGKPVTIVLSDTSANGLLTSLLGGSLGSVVTGLLGDLALGTPTLTMQARTNTGTVVHTSEFEPGDAANIGIGPDGYYYLTLTPSAAYRRISITYSNDAVLGLATESAILLNGVFVLDGAADPCDPYLLTSYDFTGISASLLNANPNPVNNPHHAIDDVAATYSTLGYSSAVALYVGATITQEVIFGSASATNEQPIITFDFPSSLLDLDLINEVEVNVYNGATNIYTNNLGSLLSLELLYFLNISVADGIPATISIPVTGAFDRVEISYTQVVSAGVAAPPLRIYDVTRGPAVPTLQSFDNISCALATFTFEVNDPIADATYVWKDSEMNIIHTGTSLTTTYPADGVADTFLVEATNCLATSGPQIFVLQGDEDICAPSDIYGDVDVTVYISPNPLNAVAANAVSSEVVASSPVDGSGNYMLSLEKGSYDIYIVNDDITIGSVVTTSSVDAGYEITPGVASFVVEGLGDDLVMPSFLIMNAPLSLNDINVNVTRQNNEILVRWSVKDATNFISFDIEKSYDGTSFNSVSKHQVNNEDQTNFSHMDIDDNNSEIFYRIKGINQNNKDVYSLIVKAQALENNGYAIYPNPSTHSIQIMNAKGNENIQILDINGRLVQEVTSYNNSIQVDALTSGIYFIMISDAKNKPTVLQFQKL